MELNNKNENQQILFKNNQLVEEKEKKKFTKKPNSWINISKEIANILFEKLTFQEIMDKKAMKGKIEIDDNKF